MDRSAMAFLKTAGQGLLNLYKEQMMMSEAYMICNKHKKDVGLTCDYQKALEILKSTGNGYIEVVDMGDGCVKEIIQYADIYK